MVKRSLNWNLDCWHLDFPAPKRDSKRYVFPTKSKMVLHNCSCRVSNNVWRLRRFGCWTNYGERCISGKTWSAQPCEDLCPQRKQRFHKAWDFPENLQTEHNRYQEIMWKNLSTWISTNLDISIKKFHDFRNRWLHANQTWKWIHLPSAWQRWQRMNLWPMVDGQCRQGVFFVVAKSRQILSYVWVICGSSVDYLWMFLPIFLWKTCKVDWFWWSKSKSWDLCHPLYTLSFKRNLLDATVARAILSLGYEKAVPWDRNCCMVVIFLDSHTYSGVFLLKDAPKHKK